MSILTPHVVRYCAQECDWQDSGELSVGWMVDAWLYAHRRRFRPIRREDILELGRLVEPRKNAGGYRQVGVRVGYDVKMDWQLVPAAMDQLLTAQQSLKPGEWFRQYEEIHPFRDGNGRTGSLLHLWLLGRLDDPIHPPNHWHDPRRDYTGYPKVRWP